MKKQNDFSEMAEACRKCGRVPVLVSFTQEGYERIEKAASATLGDGWSVQGFIASSALLIADGELGKKAVAE